VTRRISHLKWVRLAENPWPKARLRGAKRQGLSYQHSVALALGLKEDLWFQFEDANGPGYCSPDGVARYQGEIIAVECKLTQTLEAVVQLEQLYRPILEMHFSLPVRTLAVCKNLLRSSPWPGPICSSLGEALASEARVPLLFLPWPKTTPSKSSTKDLARAGA
jgi:hypothetical protein